MGKKVISGSSISTINFECIIIANTHVKEILSQFVFWFYTLNVWGSCDEDILWAKRDDDLITKMMDFVKKGKLDFNLKSKMVI